MYSVAPIVLRSVHQDVQLGRYVIPSGTVVLVHLYGMHNTSRNWESHKDFRPVRPHKPK